MNAKITFAGITCGHAQMEECHPGCGHFSCPCGISWDEGSEGPDSVEMWDVVEAAEYEMEAVDWEKRCQCDWCRGGSMGEKPKDAEIEAIGDCLKALEPLDEVARTRALRFVLGSLSRNGGMAPGLHEAGNLFETFKEIAPAFDKLEFLDKVRMLRCLCALYDITL